MSSQDEVPGQEALFPAATRTRVIDYSRPDGEPLTDADFDRLAALAAARTTQT